MVSLIPYQRRTQGLKIPEYEIRATHPAVTGVLSCNRQSFMPRQWVVVASGLNRDSIPGWSGDYFFSDDHDPRANGGYGSARGRALCIWKGTQFLPDLGAWVYFGPKGTKLPPALQPFAT